MSFKDGTNLRNQVSLGVSIPRLLRYSMNLDDTGTGPFPLCKQPNNTYNLRKLGNPGLRCRGRREFHTASL